MNLASARNGRKYTLSLLGLLLLTGMTCLSLYSQVIVSILPTYIGGLLGLLGLYFGGNIANKVATNRGLGAPKPPVVSDSEEPSAQQGDE